MRRLVLTIPFVLMAGAALAQDGPNSLAMSCAAVQGIVQSRGRRGDLDRAQHI